MTQGTLFTCATAEAYRDCEVHGLIITARCDTAHEGKTQTFNYIPIVRLSDWLKRDFIVITSARDRPQLEASLSSALESAAFSPTILLTQEPRSILERLFNGDDKKIRAAKPKFEKGVKQWEVFQSLRIPLEVPLPTVTRHFRKTHETVIKECVNQRLAGYYFLSSVIPSEGDGEGYVALLREVHHMPTTLARKIAKGLPADDYKQLCESSGIDSSKLDFTLIDFAMPIGMIRSPELEHLMQAFALLFTRIGISEPDLSYIENLCMEHLGDKNE
jgi:hypothetical protein